LTDFVALYRGRTVAEAELIAVSAEERLVRRFFVELLGGSDEKQDGDAETPPACIELVRNE
jgi:hypothetical protein